MSYIKIHKDKLVNLEYSLKKELIRSNRAGSYACTTLGGCNTRKYHGLLVSPLKDGNRHVLLSTVDETIIQNNKEFRLGIHHYLPNVYHPHGQRYMTGFDSEPIPARTYMVGGVILKKELLLSQEDERILLKYTIEDAHSATTLRLQPFLAFRNIHELSKENMNVITKTQEIQNGIKYRMYDNYPFLYMQTSKNGKFITAPDWNKNNLYSKERERGYDYLEDLFTIGFFDISVKKGDEVIFSVGLSEVKTKGLQLKFKNELKKRIPRISFENNLLNAAQQFFVNKKNEARILAGFPWYGSSFRRSLLAITGLTLYNNNTKKFIEVLDVIINKVVNNPEKFAVDIPLHIIRVIQEYVVYAENCEKVWKKFGENIIKIVQNIKAGKHQAVLHENSLLYIPEELTCSTWMKEKVNGKAVTPRTGFVVDVNALWYNALQYLSAVAEINNSKVLEKEIKGLPEKVHHFFNVIFINEEGKYLYDYVNNEEQNDDIRPNQIFAVSLPYSPLSDKIKKNVLQKVEKHLYTEKGMRTLSPKNPKYQGKYFGDENQRNNARHQGTIHPWLVAEYSKAWINLYKGQGLNYVEKIYKGFESEMSRHGLGTISELYDGNPPHNPNGAISYAPSVGALLRIKMLIDECKTMK